MDKDIKNSSVEVKTLLMNKYQGTFIDKLSLQDLNELKFSLKNQYDQNSGWNRDYKLKFESRLLHYFHEDVLRREIASIEALIRLLIPEDLKH
jgi:DNA-binding MurR/RpiR family transcriptional regulator